MDTENLLILIKMLRDELKKKDKTIKKLQLELAAAQSKVQKTKSIIEQHKKQRDRCIFDYKMSCGDFFQLEQRNKLRYGSKVKLYFNSIGANLKQANLMISKVTMCKYDEKMNDYPIVIKREMPSNEIYKHLYYKDRFYVSDETYRQLRNTLEIDDIFHCSQLVAFRQKINILFKIMIVELDKNCMMLNFQIIMRIRLTRYLQSMRESTCSKGGNGDKTIGVKISSDGTPVGNKLSFVNLTCTFPGEANVARSINGNYTLGICKTNESYENYLKPFEYLNDEISKLTSFTRDGDATQYKIVYAFVGDLPALRSTLGLTGSNSSYPCFCCKVHKNDIYALNYDYSIFNSAYKRSYAEQYKIVSDPILGKTTQTNFGYKQKPLMYSIDYTNFCYDTLHLEINISRYLVTLFERELMSLDRITTNSTLDFRRHVRLAKYFEFLNDQCNLNLDPMLNVKNGQIKMYRSLRCHEYHKIFKRINIMRDFSEIRDAPRVHRIWNDTQLIFSNIKRNVCTHTEMKRIIRSWFAMFSLHYSDVDSRSIYVHILVHHTHEFMKIHGNIHNLNLQGLEKLNDQTTSEYFRSTNKKDLSLSQMLSRRLRIEVYETGSLELIREIVSKAKENKDKHPVAAVDLDAEMNNELDDIPLDVNDDDDPSEATTFEINEHMLSATNVDNADDDDDDDEAEAGDDDPDEDVNMSIS